MADSSVRQRALEIFEQAVEWPAEKRAALLDAACGDDAELRAEVESLLEHDSRAGDDFLRPPEPPPRIRPPSEPDAPDPLVGTRVGNYLVKKLIAAGGMGSVYEAEQEQPRRIVALKVMSRNVASRSALRRFQFESQMLARLRNPNIAQVYEAGMATIHVGQPPSAVSSAAEDAPAGGGWATSGDARAEGAPAGGGWATSVPYFAMEYVPDAKTITQYVQDHGLATRERLGLFVKVCDAVHHGHQKGVIHRDLKPGNILVDAGGEPKVIDFGVARATDSDVAVTTMQTDVGQLIGTMQYMSPEQCDADPHELDTRSDVYSLGVVLYELLAGALPYETRRSSIFQATRIIKEQPPRKLSLISAKLRGDVETITLKALEKDRARRYQSVAELAQDIRRHLNREPIAARAPTAWTRAVRFAARYPKLTTAGACLCVGALATLATVGMFYRWLNVKPYKMWISGDEREAWLVAFSGKRLHAWRTEAPGRVKFAQLVEEAAGPEQRRVALLGFEQVHKYNYGRSLCAFDVEGDLDSPIWERHVETGELPEELRGDRPLVGEDFAVHHCWVYDVFPERLGDEIVASFACKYSPRALRIYDLRGELLYQVWHDGTLNSCYWMSDAGLLVFSGDNAEKYWVERGHSEVEDRPFPMVVFAIRPQVGVVVDGWLGSEPGKGDVSPEWYRCLLPVGAVDAADGPFELGAPTGAYNPGRFAYLDLTVSWAKGIAVAWVIDENGQEVEGTRSLGDHYRLNQKLPDGAPGKLPDPNVFRLVPWEQSQPDAASP